MALRCPLIVLYSHISNTAPRLFWSLYLSDFIHVCQCFLHFLLFICLIYDASIGAPSVWQKSSQTLSVYHVFSPACISGSTHPGGSNCRLNHPTVLSFSLEPCSQCWLVSWVPRVDTSMGSGSRALCPLLNDSWDTLDGGNSKITGFVDDLGFSCIQSVKSVKNIKTLWDWEGT